MIANDGPHRRKTQTTSLLFCCIEGIEYPFQVIRWDTDALVYDIYSYMVT